MRADDILRDQFAARAARPATNGSEQRSVARRTPLVLRRVIIGDRFGSTVQDVGDDRASLFAAGSDVLRVASD